MQHTACRRESGAFAEQTGAFSMHRILANRIQEKGDFTLTAKTPHHTVFFPSGILDGSRR